jgi:hypothetical protein
MTKKQVSAKPVSAKTNGASTPAASAVSARAAAPKTSRVRTSKHSKASVTIDTPEVSSPVATPFAGSYDAISAIAYKYWENRGRQDGSALEDWVRAEAEYRGSIQ